MNQTYVYRKHLRAPGKFMGLLLLIIVGSMFLASMVMTTVKGEKISAEILIVFIIAALAVSVLIGIEYLLLYFVLFRRFKSISVTLTENELIYINSKKKTVIPYEEIKKLDFPSIKYTGGLMKIAYNGGNIRLTVVLENIGDMIKTLKEKLDERDMTDVYDDKKLFSFYKTAVFSDESWDRIYKSYKILIASVIAGVIASAAIVNISGNTRYMGHMFTISIFSVLAGYLISEIIIGTKVKKRVNSENLSISERETVLERKIFNICIIASLAVLLVIIILGSFVA